MVVKEKAQVVEVDYGYGITIGDINNIIHI
jgi:hypothetical protein